MSFSRKLRQAMALPPHIIVKKAYEIGLRTLKRSLLRSRDYQSCTYSLHYTAELPLLHYVVTPNKDSLQRYKPILDELSLHYMAHRLDVLGSGWTSLLYGTQPRGTEGHIYSTDIHSADDTKFTAANRQESTRISRLLPQSYQPMDWQRDIKSGYRWSEAKWYKDNRYGSMPGVDVKLPWEIARFHHLVHIAYCHTLLSEGTNNSVFADEFRNQILDFIAYNPPRFGVNWVTSMDVGIRAANILTAYDIFIASGYRFDEEFELILKRSIYEHGKHIIRNLEWSADLRGNHYLADCVGLLYCAAYLPSSPEINAWLAFSIQEISAEILLQFLPDGGNFEASVPYHRLSLEMVLYAIALIHALPDEKTAVLAQYNNTIIKGKPALKPAPMPFYKTPEYCIKAEQKTPLHPEVYERIIEAIRFTFSMVEFADEIPQIGDNDSGRFLKMTPEFIHENGELSEIENNHTHVLGLASALFYDSVLEEYAKQFPLENIYTTVTISPKKRDILKTKDSTAFRDFGLYLFTKQSYSCAVRAGSIGQRGKGGHAHNDQLSFIFALEGTIFFTDPGTYLYTPAWKQRNRFRGTAMHNTLSVHGMEQNQWVEGAGDVLFWMLGDRAKASVERFDTSVFIGEHKGYGANHKRILTCSDTEIIGKDICNVQGKKQLNFHLAPKAQYSKETDNSLIIHCNNKNIRFTSDERIMIEESDFSNGYGKKTASKKLTIPMNGSECTWKISINI